MDYWGGGGGAKGMLLAPSQLLGGLSPRLSSYAYGIIICPLINDTKRRSMSARENLSLDHTVSGHKYFIEVRIPIDFSAFFSVQEN